MRIASSRLASLAVSAAAIATAGCGGLTSAPGAPSTGSTVGSSGAAPLPSSGTSGASTGGPGASTGHAITTLEVWATSNIDPMVALYEAAHPNVSVNVVQGMSQAALDASLAQRLMSGSPPSQGMLDASLTQPLMPGSSPDAAEANLGLNATQFVGSALTLTSAWTQSAAGVFSPGVLDLVSRNGNVIGVPLGLTRQNAAYWNWRVIHTLKPPLNAIPVGTAAFASWLQAVSAAGYAHPLCFGFKDAWVNAHILFEDVVPAIEGLQKDKAYWTGTDATGGSMMTDALDWAKTNIYPYLSADSSTNPMSAGVNRLMTQGLDPTTGMPDPTPAGTCLMTAMGDWGGHQLLSPPDNYVPGTADAPTYTSTSNGTTVTKPADFIGGGFPGAENLVVFSGDAMMAFQGSGHEADVAALFDTMASPLGQVEFAALNGAMPARIDLPATAAAQFKALPILIQANIQDVGMASGAVPGYKVMGQQPKQYNSDLATQAQNFFLSGDPTPLLAYMSQNYAQIPKVP